MGKKKKAEKESNVTPINPEKLTPWQRENLRYLKKQENKNEQEKETKKNKKEKTKKKKESEPEKPIATPEEIKEVEEVASFKTVKDLPKSESYADRLPKLSEERQKRLRRRLTILLTVFGLIGLGTLYYVSPLIRLNQLKVTGNEKVTKEKIALASNLKADENIWQAYFNPKIEENIKNENPRIKTVKVSLNEINNLLLTVTEYEEVAYAKEGKIFHPILENGKTLSEEVAVEKKEFPILLNFKEQEELANLLAVYKEIPADIKTKIKEIQKTPTTSNQNLITLIMEDGNHVLASTIDMSEKIILYNQIVAEMDFKGIIDMEAGIYSYPFPKAETATENDE